MCIYNVVGKDEISLSVRWYNYGERHGRRGEDEGEGEEGEGASSSEIANYAANEGATLDRIWRSIEHYRLGYRDPGWMWKHSIL